MSVIGNLKSEAWTTAKVNKIPRANGSGVIDQAWILMIPYVVSATEPVNPDPGLIWNDTTDDQLKIRTTSGTWRQFA